MEFNTLKNILEGALLASGSPMSVHRLAALFEEGENVANADISRALQALAEDCAGRGVELVEVASGYRYQVRGEVHDWVAKLWTERPSRYSRALLETLALIAYRQPITRGEIEAVRGVSVSSSIIKTLEEREWIRVVGHRDVPGRPALFGTTREFLDYFKLKSLDELPSLAEIRDMEAFDPQLSLDGEGTPARAALPGEASAAEQDAGEAEGEAPVAPMPVAEDAPAESGAGAGTDAPSEGDDSAQPRHEAAADADAVPATGENTDSADIDAQSDPTPADASPDASDAAPADEAPAPATDPEGSAADDTQEKRA